MSIRKLFLILSLAATSLATSCTTRYQDMLKERDQQIRDLSGTVARQRGEIDDLNRRATATPAVTPTEANADKGAGSMMKEIEGELGEGASIGYDRGGRISIGVANEVTFDSGSTKLKDTSHKVLRNVASVLKNRFSGKRYYIEGHTDSDPITKTKDVFRSNRHLSMERADSVAAYLIQQGVPESAIVVVGYGQFDPVDSKAKSKNRRVQIVVGDKL